MDNQPEKLLFVAPQGALVRYRAPRNNLRFRKYCKKNQLTFHQELGDHA